MSNADRHDRRAKAIYAPVGGSRMINVDVNSFNKMGSVFYAALNFYFNLFHRLKELTFLERGAHLVLPPGVTLFAIVVAPWQSPAITGIPRNHANPAGEARLMPRPLSEREAKRLLTIILQRDANNFGLVLLRETMRRHPRSSLNACLSAPSVKLTPDSLKHASISAMASMPALHNAVRPSFLNKKWPRRFNSCRNMAHCADVSLNF